MATVLDISLLKGFVDIFVWLLIFIVVYGGLELTNLLKNRGLHALFAFVITAVIVLTGGGVNIIVAMAPWVVVMAALMFFVLMLAGFAGLKTNEVFSSVFGGSGGVWFILIPLFIIMIVAWTQGPKATTVIDQTTGEEIVVEQQVNAEQRPFISILTSPKILGLILIMAVAAMTLLLMAGSGGTVG